MRTLWIREAGAGWGGCFPDSLWILYQTVETRCRGDNCRDVILPYGFKRDSDCVV